MVVGRGGLWAGGGRRCFAGEKMVRETGGNGLFKVNFGEMGEK